MLRSDGHYTENGMLQSLAGKEIMLLLPDLQTLHRAIIFVFG